MKTRKNLIISPHTDDAVFSMGSHIVDTIGNNNTYTILSPLAGIPQDPAGRKKHTTLRKEHKEACEFLGAQHIEGDFLDDVYPRPSLAELKKYLIQNCRGYDRIYIPLGIHHPDHILIRDIIIEAKIQYTHIYEEMPYNDLYPQLVIDNQYAFIPNGAKGIHTEHDPIKEDVVGLYASQIIGGEILKHLYLKETIWEM